MKQTQSIIAHHLSSVWERLYDLFTCNEAWPYFSRGFLKRGMCQLAALSPWMKPQANSLLLPFLPLVSSVTICALCYHCQTLFKWLIYEWIQKLQIIKDTQIIGLFSEVSVPCAAARFLPNEYIQWQWGSWVCLYPWGNEPLCFVTACGSGKKKWHPLHKFPLNAVFFPINDTLRIHLRGY